MARRAQQPQSPDIEPVSEVVQTVDETFAGGAVPVDDEGNEIDLDLGEDEDEDDDDDYGSVERNTPQPGSPQPVANGDVTRTSNFFGHNKEGSMVQDRGIEVVERDLDTNIVRVIEDVGPIFLGRRRQLQLLKGVAYKVDSDILQYLRERNLVMGE
jgi:hypothetical protein